MVAATIVSAAYVAFQMMADSGLEAAIEAYEASLAEARADAQSIIAEANAEITPDLKL